MKSLPKCQVVLEDGKQRGKPLHPKMTHSGQFSVIGLGGVGSIVARYAAVFLASLDKSSHISLVDGDSFEQSNATRMIFGDYGNKASVVRKELLPRFKNSSLAILATEEYVTEKNIGSLIVDKDVILMCVDNHNTRKLVSDHCKKLRNICLISGGNDGVGKGRRGTYGNVQLYVRKNGKELTYALDAFHPEIKEPQDKHPEDLNCTELVVSTPQILFANLAVASAMLNTLMLYLSGVSHYSELSFDIADALCRPTIKLKGPL